MCSSLVSITIPNTVTSIGDEAFYCCSSLASVTFEGESQPTSIGRVAFDGCSSLVSITIPESVTSIGDSAFSRCDNLMSITIPSSVVSIGYQVFDGCDNLNYTEYSNAKYLGNSSNPYLYLWETTNRDFTSCTINSNCKFIGSYAFSRCDNLMSITIPSSVVSIGDYAFDGCSSLESITIPNSVTSIGRYAFRECSNLTIYCRASSQPSGWDEDWNYRNRPVVWGYMG